MNSNSQYLPSRPTKWIAILVSITLTFAPALANAEDFSYLLQYELSFGKKKSSSSVYFGLQRQVDDFESNQYRSFMAAPRIPLFQTQTPTLKSNEADESKKGLPQAVVAVIVAGIVIAVAYAYYDDCPPEDSLAGKC